jgi:hypothetical protein
VAGEVIRVRLADFAASTVEIYASEDWSEEAPQIEAVCRAWRESGRTNWLNVEPEQAETVIDGLVVLANTEDDEVERLGRLPRLAEREACGEQRKYAKAACSGLSGAASRLASALVERGRRTT